MLYKTSDFLKSPDVILSLLAVFDAAMRHQYFASVVVIPEAFPLDTSFSKPLTPARALPTKTSNRLDINSADDKVEPTGGERFPVLEEE